MFLSIVIPVYKAEGTIRELYSRLKSFLEGLAVDFEIIMVDDGGEDRSWDIISEIAGQDKRLKGIQFSRNYGQHNALLCGILRAKGDVIITMDDDLQHPPEEIPKLLDKLAEGYDVVYGTPIEEQHGFFRDMASVATKVALRSVMGAETARSVSAFRAIRTYVRNAFTDYKDPFLMLDVLLTWGTNRFAAVPVRHEIRKVGTSNYTFRKLFVHALNMTTGFSTVPLQLASLLGFLFTLFGILILLFVLGRYIIQGTSMPGFPFLASIIAIFSGVQLFSLGIIGEYLARMHFRTMGRPSSVVSRTVGFPERDTEENI